MRPETNETDHPSTIPGRCVFEKCSAQIIAINDEGGIIFDKTNFYATSGGQPGDTGIIELENGQSLEICNTVKGKTTGAIALIAGCEHLPDIRSLIAIGDNITCTINWQRRYKLMQMHTACHLLSVVCPYPITNANIAETESRVDFDMPKAPGNKQEISAAIMQLGEADHQIYDKWIDEAQLDENPDLVKSKNVKPPRGTGSIRLVCIGENSSIDSQPCYGTHVNSILELGAVHIAKIENKDKENVFTHPPCQISDVLNQCGYGTR